MENVNQNGSLTSPGPDNPGLRHYREDRRGGGDVLHTAMDIVCRTAVGCDEEESK